MKYEVEDSGGGYYNSFDDAVKALAAAVKIGKGATVTAFDGIHIVLMLTVSYVRKDYQSKPLPETVAPVRQPEESNCPKCGRILPNHWSGCPDSPGEP